MSTSYHDWAQVAMERAWEFHNSWFKIPVEDKHKAIMYLAYAWAHARGHTHIAIPNHLTDENVRKFCMRVIMDLQPQPERIAA